MNGKKKQLALLCSAVIMIGLTACESNGTTRVSSVGQRGLQGAKGDVGPEGPAGPQGPAGANGGLGQAGALAVGGLVGPNGVAGTGLLANTGDPNNRIPAVSGVLVATGNGLMSLSTQGAILANIVDSHAPGGLPLAGRVVGVVQATGQALVQTGNGQQYLVDGLTAAPGQLINVTVGNAQVIGSSNTQAGVGGSILSPTQAQGSGLTVGLGSQGQLLTLNNGAAGSTGATNALSGVVGTATGVGSGLPTGANGGSSQPATGVVTNVTGTVTGLLGGPH